MNLQALRQHFADMDANRDGRVSFEEFHAYHERMLAQHERRMFDRLSGGQGYFTLEQLNARGPVQGRPVPGGPGPQ